MSRLPRVRLSVLARWPRRLAAATCLLLAGLSATAHPPPARRAVPAQASVSPTVRLRPGQVAMPVRLAGGAAFVTPGVRIDLFAGPSDSAALDGPIAPATTPPAGGHLVAAQNLLVLAVHGVDIDSGAASTTSSEVLVAMDRGTAARLAALQGRQIFAALDKSP